MSRQLVALAVHGGAGRLSKRRTSYPGRRPYERALAEALWAGQSVLLRGRSAVSAVAAAVRVLEDCPLLNAAHGAVLCADGSIELSASVMKGRDLAAGAMVGLKRTKNPVLAAQAFLKHSHGLIFGEQADAYSEQIGLEMVENEYFYTDARRKQWRKRRKRGAKVALDHSDDDDDVQGTVGAIALDRRGNLAAATSTGGLVNQLPGRVGDSPIVGAGTWADNRVCAVSATGKGDVFARMAFSRHVADLVELTGASIETAGRRALDEVKRIGGEGGCIIMNRQGEIACPFNSRQMLRGWVTEAGPAVVAMLPGEEVVVDAR